MIKEVLLIATVLLGIPAGFWIAWLCRDELLQGRRWFKLIMISSILLVSVMLIFGNYVIALTMLFIWIIAYISLLKSKDKKWTKRKI